MTGIDVFLAAAIALVVVIFWVILRWVILRIDIDDIESLKEQIDGISSAVGSFEGQDQDNRRMIDDYYRHLSKRLNELEKELDNQKECIYCQPPGHYWTIDADGNKHLVHWTGRNIKRIVEEGASPVEDTGFVVIGDGNMAAPPSPDGWPDKETE